jgi:lysophospholipid acyltransferase (LPLAT)-like uncharacterized protein
MRLSKRILHHRITQSILCRFLYGYILFCHHTTRWIVVGRDRLDALAATNTPIVMVFWHGRLCMIPNIWPNHFPQMNVVVSFHRDGEMIGSIIRYFGFNLIRGSTGKQGALVAFRESVRKLKNGEALGFTPDGPRGPRMHAVTTGVVEITRNTGATLMPVTFSTSRCKIFKSWDRFMLPLPFGQGTFIYGNTITPSVDATREQVEVYRQQLEDELNRITHQADVAMGITPIKPAEPLV